VKVLDFAGGTVVHINAGVAGLMCAIMLGKAPSSTTQHQSDRKNVGWPDRAENRVDVGAAGASASTSAPNLFANGSSNAPNKFANVTAPQSNGRLHCDVTLDVEHRSQTLIGHPAGCPMGYPFRKSMAHPTVDQRGR
jgi:hypothetical protein